MENTESQEIVEAVDRATSAIQGLLYFVLYNVVGTIVIGLGAAITIFWQASPDCDMFYTRCEANNGPQVFGAILMVVASIATIALSVNAVRVAIRRSSR